MAGARGHSNDDHAGSDDHAGAADRGTWILGVLASAVLAFALAGALIRAVDADGAPVAEAPTAAVAGHGEGSSAAAEVAGAQESGPAGSVDTVVEAPTTVPSTLPPPVPSTEPPPVPTTTVPPQPIPDVPTAGPTTPVPVPATPSARPGGDRATPSESAAASTFARLVRQNCDLSRIPDPGQVRSTDLGGGVFQIVDANATVLQIDVGSNLVMAADSLDGTVSGGYSDACAPALFGG